MFQVNRNPTTTEIRKFGRAMLIGFGAIGVLLWVLGAWKSGATVLSWSGSWRSWLSVGLVGLGVALWVLCSFHEPIARRVYVTWMSVTVPIGIFMSTIVLSIMYFLLLPIFSLLVRRSDPLRKRRNQATYWEPYKSCEPTIERMQRLF